MKARYSIALLITAWAFAVSAADPVTELLQKGLFEEEANHDLQAAIQSYQSVVALADQQRKLAATAGQIEADKPKPALDPSRFMPNITLLRWGRTGFDWRDASEAACRGWFVGLVKNRTET